MILSKLEMKEHSKREKNYQQSGLSKVAKKLDKIYLQLIDLYLELNNVAQCRQALSLLESRLERLSNSHEYSYRMMNELANTLHRHKDMDLALNYYKKALLCMKRRHKNKYLDHSETAKIIINMATVYFIIENFAESLKYHHHAIEVLDRVLRKMDGAAEQGGQVDRGSKERQEQLYQDALAEKGKVHMSCANIYRMLGQRIEARDQYRFALDQFEICKEEKHGEMFENHVQGEFRPLPQSVNIS